MLSPVKLYKYDKKVARKAITSGPKGKPGKDCSGTTCYRHPNVDWAVHRLTPAVYEGGKPGGKRRKVMTKAATAGLTGKSGRLNLKQRKILRSAPKGMRPALKNEALKSNKKQGTYAANALKRDTSKHLQKTSPRWGEGIAPGRRGRKAVPLPPRHEVEVSTSTKVGAGAAAGAGGGALAHRRSEHKGIKNK